MSVVYKSKLHRKDSRIIALLRPAVVYRARTFNIASQRYVYLVEVIFEGEENPVKVMPNDIEEFSNCKL